MDNQNVIYTVNEIEPGSPALQEDSLPGKSQVKHYSVLKKKKILTYATMWIKLEDTMLSEITHS